MEDLTGVFFSKYSSLDAMCRRKYGFTYNEDGTRDNRSGVLEFAKELPKDLSRELTDIHYKRNDVAHENKFQVRPTQEVIDRLNFFIELFKSKYSEEDKKDNENKTTNTVSVSTAQSASVKQSEPKDEPNEFVRAILAKMDTRIGELTLAAKHLPEDKREKILKKCANYANSVKSAGTQEFANNAYLAFEKFAVQALAADGETKAKKQQPTKVAVKAAKGVASNNKAVDFWQEKQLEITKLVATLTKLVGEYPTKYQTAVTEAERMAEEIKSAHTAENAENKYKELQVYIEDQKELIKLQKDKLREMKKFVQAVQSDDEYNCTSDVKQQICHAVEGYMTDMYATLNKTEIDGVWEKFKAYRGVQKKKYRTQSQQTVAAATSSQVSVGFPWGKVIGIAVAALVVAGVVCLVVFRKSISWTDWQYIIGSVGGLVLTAILAVVCFFIDENVNTSIASTIGLGIVAIANMVVCFVVGANYRIICTWLFAYALIWGGMVAFSSFGDGKRGWLIAQLCEIGVVVLGLILVWTLI